MKRFLSCAAIFLLFSGISLRAETPEEVAKRQIDAMKAGDWTTFAASMHEPALKEFQDTIVSILTKAPDAAVRQQMLATLLGGQTLEQVTAASPTAFFGSFMRGLAQSNPAVKQGMATAEGQIIGHVEEGPDKVHVVTRMTMAVGDGRMTKMEVTSMQRDGDTWKALLKGDMQAVVSSLTRMLTPTK